MIISDLSLTAKEPLIKAVVWVSRINDRCRVHARCAGVNDTRLVGAAFLNGGRSSLSFGAQAPLDEHQVGQGKERVELRGVLGQAPVTGPAVPKEVFDDVKGMLDVGAHLRLGLFQGLG